MSSPTTGQSNEPAHHGPVGISLERVSKSYDGKAAVTETDLSVPPRSTLVLIGPSGCGKSTVLRLIIGLISPDSGRVLIGDKRMEAGTRRELRLTMGYVIQEGGLFPHLTAAENVAIVARDLGWNQSRMRSRITELAELTGIEPDLLERYPAQLSGGQRQRIGIMRALMLDPDVLLLDEPLGALDPMIRSRLQTDLGELFSRLRKTVILVTHDMAEAVYFGDEIVLMRDGVILQRGSPQDLQERPADPFVTAFIRAQRFLHDGEAPQ
jgi:osmoprotectant transport system ATP-binding protein